MKNKPITLKEARAIGIDFASAVRESIAVDMARKMDAESLASIPKPTPAEIAKAKREERERAEYRRLNPPPPPTETEILDDAMDTLDTDDERGEMRGEKKAARDTIRQMIEAKNAEIARLKAKGGAD